MMYWICVSHEEIAQVLRLLEEHLDFEYAHENYGNYQRYVQSQKLMHELKEKLIVVLEHDR